MGRGDGFSVGEGEGSGSNIIDSGNGETVGDAVCSPTQANIDSTAMTANRRRPSLNDSLAEVENVATGVGCIDAIIQGNRGYRI